VTEDNICITNYVDDLSSCTYPGVHLDTCTGSEFRFIWVGDRPEPSPERSLVTRRLDNGNYQAVARPCQGCVPRRAEVGFVCRGCFAGIEKAVSDAPDLVAALDGIDKVKTSDTEGRGSVSVGYVPLPATRLAIDELRRYLDDGGTAEMRVSNSFRAENAVRLARAYTTAVRTFPLQEDPHPVKRTWCPECEQLSLVWRPPLLLGMEVRVECRNPECRHVIDQDGFEALTNTENNDYAKPTRTVDA